MPSTGESRRLNDDQLAEYFERIKLPEEFRNTSRPSLAQLEAIKAAHLLTIPWENCTLVIPELRDSNDTPLATDFTVERLLDKMVRRQRGGYCFEQTALLELVLRSLCYDVHSAAARVVDGEALQPDSSEVPLGMQLHQASPLQSATTWQVLLVQLQGRTYLLDVAFMSDNASQLLPLEHMAATAPAGELPCGQRQHRLRRGVIFSSREALPSDSPAALGWYLQPFRELLAHHGSEQSFDSLQVDSHAVGWKDCYFFQEAVYTAFDFIPGNFYMASHENSPFNKVPHISIMTPEGRKTLIDRRLRIFAGKTLLSERTVADAELKQTLAQEFGIVY